jgi:hypothetical protein
MKIDKIITENINKVITEGYGSKILENEVRNKIPKIIKWMKYCSYDAMFLDDDMHHYISKEKIEIDINKVLGNSNAENIKTILVKYIYLPKKVIESGAYGESFYDVYEPVVECYFGSNTTENDIFDCIIHELSHAVDSLILNEKPNIIHHTHQKKQMVDYNLPQCIQDLLYILWDTTEFNAWQTTYHRVGGDFNEFFETMMYNLEKAYEIDDNNVWSSLRYYLISRGMEKFKTVQLSSIKKYFINTTFKKLKKFIKKIKL